MTKQFRKLNAIMAASFAMTTFVWASISEAQHCEINVKSETTPPKLETGRLDTGVLTFQNSGLVIIDFSGDNFKTAIVEIPQSNGFVLVTQSDSSKPDGNNPILTLGAFRANRVTSRTCQEDVSLEWTYAPNKLTLMRDDNQPFSNVPRDCLAIAIEPYGIQAFPIQPELEEFDPYATQTINLTASCHS